MVLSTMTMQMPAMMALMKKKRKIWLEYQSGWSLPGAMMKSEPSADWCMVENITESTVRPSSAFLSGR